MTHNMFKLWVSFTGEAKKTPSARYIWGLCTEPLFSDSEIKLMPSIKLFFLIVFENKEKFTVLTQY